jgi:Restriction endonuclease
MRHTKRKQFKILKASGRTEPFSKKKLFQSLERTGLPPKECHNISNIVAGEVNEGSQTKDIYKKTLNLVRKASPLATVHYSLKKSLFELGPEGHHFEIFVGKYFEEIGYATETCSTLQGKYVKHEVDVIASLNGKRIFSECKFHNHAGVKNDVKISLYVKARWDDLKDGPEGINLKAFYVVSNTSFTLDAITYANGTGLHLLGVNMPEGDSFLDKIKKLKLYPITSLRHLPKLFKKELLARNVVLAREIKDHTALLLNLGMQKEDLNILIDEINMLTWRQQWK